AGGCELLRLHKAIPRQHHQDARSCPTAKARLASHGENTNQSSADVRVQRRRVRTLTQSFALGIIAPEFGDSILLAPADFSFGLIGLLLQRLDLSFPL